MKHFRLTLLILFVLTIATIIGAPALPVVTPVVEVGGAVGNNAGDVEAGGYLPTTTTKGGFLEFKFKNTTGEDATNVHFSLNTAGYFARAVVAKTGSRVPTGVTPFSDISTGNFGETTLGQPDYTEGSNSVPLPNDGTITIELQVEISTDGGQTWQPCPAGVKFEIWRIHFTKGMFAESRRPILKAKCVEANDTTPETVGLEDEVEEETSSSVNTTPSAISTTEANSATPSVINVPDIIIASVGYDGLSDGSFILTSPHGLPLSLNNAVAYILPYKPANVEVSDELLETIGTKFYLNEEEGGGVFAHTATNILSTPIVTANNEIQIVLNCSHPDGVPWELKTLKPGAILIRGVQFTIGDEIGSVEEWQSADKVYIGFKGTMIGITVESLWHVATIS